MGHCYSSGLLRECLIAPLSVISHLVMRERRLTESGCKECPESGTSVQFTMVAGLQPPTFGERSQDI